MSTHDEYNLKKLKLRERFKSNPQIIKVNRLSIESINIKNDEKEGMDTSINTFLDENRQPKNVIVSNPKLNNNPENLSKKLQFEKNRNKTLKNELKIVTQLNQLNSNKPVNKETSEENIILKEKLDALKNEFEKKQSNLKSQKKFIKEKSLEIKNIEYLFHEAISKKSNNQPKFSREDHFLLLEEINELQQSVLQKQKIVNDIELYNEKSLKIKNVNYENNYLENKKVNDILKMKLSVLKNLMGVLCNKREKLEFRSKSMNQEMKLVKSQMINSNNILEFINTENKVEVESKLPSSRLIKHNQEELKVKEEYHDEFNSKNILENEKLTVENKNIQNFRNTEESFTVKNNFNHQSTNQNEIHAFLPKQKTKLFSKNPLKVRKSIN